MPTTTTTRPTPRIYVACLAAYNDGKLHGTWVDANQSPDDMQEEIDAMLALSPIPLAEQTPSMTTRDSGRPDG